MAASRLAELTVMDRTTLTRNLDVLEKQGLPAMIAALGWRASPSRAGSR